MISYLIYRGTKNNFHLSRKDGYHYTLDTNELFLKKNGDMEKVLYYEELSIDTLYNLDHERRFFQYGGSKKDLPKECETGQIFLCIDTKELYIGNDGKPVLVLSSIGEMNK